MADVRAPHDMLGNELHIGDLVIWHPDRPLVCKITALQNGGIHTNQGITPALIRLVTDSTLGAPAGANIAVLVRIISPGSEEALKRILEASPPPAST